MLLELGQTGLICRFNAGSLGAVVDMRRLSPTYLSIEIVANIGKDKSLKESEIRRRGQRQ
jgi:hypothetical protein